MNEIEQRIAIAKFCGWSNFDHSDILTGEIKEGGKTLFFRKVPDYLNDLNAMHEAEKLLGVKKYDYITWLERSNTGGRNNFQSHTANARTRAQAFLYTLDLWK